MNRWGRWPARDSWAVKLSYRFYRVLLIVCPAAFRREYGAEMARLFRDCCREAWRRGGALAMLDLWGRALVDLAATAASERIKAGITVPARILIRVAGLAGLIAGAWYMLLFVLMFSFMQTPYIFLPNLPIQSALLVATIPATWALFCIALFGLHLHLARLLERQGLLGELGRLLWMARGVTCGGAVLSLVAGPLALHSAGSAWFWPFTYLVVFYIYGAHIGFMGYVVLGIGLLGTGWVALRTRAFGFWSWLPLLASALALLNGIFTNLRILQAPCCTFDPRAATGTSVIQLAFFLLWSAGWIFLGHRLWSRPLGSRSRKSAFASVD